MTEQLLEEPAVTKDDRMSILIKGVELPKEGHIFVCIHADGKVYKESTEYAGIWSDVATAVPVPPHGGLKAIKTLTQNVLDKIRAEFINKYPKNYMGEPELGGMMCAFSLNNVLDVIDKYKVESEGQ